MNDKSVRSRLLHFQCVERQPFGLEAAGAGNCGTTHLIINVLLRTLQTPANPANITLP